MAAPAVIAAARRDPNLFIEYVLNLEQAPLHEEMQHHYSAHPEGPCGVGAPRGHAKTVQTCGRVAWEIGHAPAARWKYIQSTDTEAAKSVEFVKNIIESERYRQVFPRIEPDPDMWGKTAFRVVSNEIHRDPTLEARGIFGHAGGRWTDLVADDVCDLENAVRRSALRLQVIEAWHNTWMKMGTGDRRRVWCVFTPWHVSDLTAEWRVELARDNRLLWRPCVGTRSPWPGAFSEARLSEERRLNPIAYARAYLLEPLSSKTLVFPAEWLEGSFFEQLPQGRDGYWAMLLDFAFTEKDDRPGHEPDWSVALVAFVDRFGHGWVHDMLRVRATFPEFKRAAIALGVRWRVKRAKGEATAGQRGLVQQMNEDAPFPVEAIDRISDKVLRASQMQPFVSGGRFHILAVRSGGVLLPVPALRKLYDEMVEFPSGDHDDTVDAAVDVMEMAMAAGSAQVRPVKRIENPWPDVRESEFFAGVGAPR